MASCGFVFDLIIVRIDIPTFPFDDPNQLSVDATFNNVPLKITSSRINVVDFRSGRSYEFDSEPARLRTELSNNPLRLDVKYNNEAIAVAEMIWPSVVLDKISANQDEITHAEECALLSGDERLGTVEIILRLGVICEEIPEVDSYQPGDDIRCQLDKVINPHDILFVVSDPTKEDSCIGLMTSNSNMGSGDERTALDLNYYRSVNGRLIPTPDLINNTCPETDCSELKKVSHQYQKIIDQLINKYNKKQQGRFAGVQRRCYSCRETEERFSSSSARDSSGMSDSRFNLGSFAELHTDNNDDCYNDDQAPNCKTQYSIPNLSQMVHKTPRKCPVCKENLSWLPKYSACPKCGYKIIPHIMEKKYNEKLTAAQVLREYLEQSSETDGLAGSLKDFCRDDKGSEKMEEQSKCRCTCRNGKICAHCRIRKLCKDIFTPRKANSDLAQTQAKNQSQLDDCGQCLAAGSELFNVCKSSSKECRPYLARVFSELRDLYDIKESKQKGFNSELKCESHLYARKQKTTRSNPDTSKSTTSKLRMRPSSPVSENKSRIMQKKKEEHNREQFIGHDLNRAKRICKKRARYVKSNRSYPGVNIGHKSCANPLSSLSGRHIVPRNMGWLWNANETNVRRGWKPGAIIKPVKEMMRYFLKDFPADTLRVSKYAYRRGIPKVDCSKEMDLEQKPTLHICKKNDEYTISLRPLKDVAALRVCADPYMNMKPICFKITKNPLLTEIRKLKRCLKEMGFNKCTCHKPVVECFCRSFLDKKRLEYQVNKECRKRNIRCCNDTLVLSDTTDSEVEFDFGVTPPVGIVKPERLNKPDLVNRGTQYVEADWNIPPLYPKKVNRYMKMCDCCTGIRLYDQFGRYYPGGVPASALGGRYAPGGVAGPGIRVPTPYAGAGGAGGGAGGAGGFGGGAKGAGGGGSGGGTVGIGPNGKLSGSFIGPDGKKVDIVNGMMRGPDGKMIPVTMAKDGSIIGPGGKVLSGPGTVGGRPNGGKVDMVNYLRQSLAREAKKSPEEKAEERRLKMMALRAHPPPLICQVDRRAKPCQPCYPCYPCNPCCMPCCCGYPNC